MTPNEFEVSKSKVKVTVTFKLMGAYKHFFFLIKFSQSVSKKITRLSSCKNFNVAQYSAEALSKLLIKSNNLNTSKDIKMKL